MVVIARVWKTQACSIFTEIIEPLKLLQMCLISLQIPLTLCLYYTWDRLSSWQDQFSPRLLFLECTSAKENLGHWHNWTQQCEEDSSYSKH